MLSLGPIAFTAPWLLIGLIILPVLWFLLRAVPPAPIQRRFPGVALLLGLQDDESQSDKTPWWLLLLRMLVVAAAILGFAGPVLNPVERTPGQGPLLVLIDGTWADARDWSRRIERVEALLTEAGRDGRPVAVAMGSDLPKDGLQFQAASAWAPRLPGLTPKPWSPEAEIVSWAEGLEGPFDTYWVSDGVGRADRSDVLAALEQHGTVQVFESPRPIYALRPAQMDEGVLKLTVLRANAGPVAQITLSALGLDPNGVERELAQADAIFPSEATEASVALSMPSELRNRVSRFEIAGVRSAGAVSLTDDALKRREVALIAGREDREGLQLLSPLHYLEQALEPTADLIGGDLSEILMANPDVIILADVARVTDDETAALTEWLEAGGLLVRFAGPRLAASDVSRDTEDPLMPVRLREGGRSVGGAMSWGEPKSLRAFDESSPFYGLEISDEVTVTAQVLAQPDPNLAEREIAALADGTPLVTAKEVGAGRVVLFHVTANAEWSTLPLSGLFVQMLERLAVSTRPTQPGLTELEGTVWQAEEVLDGFGRIETAGALPGIPGPDLVQDRLGPEMPPGLYAGEERRLALNVIRPETELQGTRWPERIVVDGLAVVQETQLKGAVLTAGLAFLLLDILASLFLSGRLGLRRSGQIASLLLTFTLWQGQAEAQESETSPDGPDAFAIAATDEVALAHVVTGNAQVDRIARAGLDGLSQILFTRTSVEPSDPISVDLEMDELSLFPFLYWPVTPDQPQPSSEAYAKLNRYLRTGGMILFDTRDADIAGFGSGTPNGRKLQQLARPLDIPPLAVIAPDHVLTRTFYLLRDFPGRYQGHDVWAEAPPADAEQVEGMPFRNLNDGVTPVVIGGNDWASAWALDERGGRMFPVGRGYAGERQREQAYRFGVNLIMHVLTGNYKSDQVHVPALLDRLGQ